ncbi:MAG TPA: CbiQ family ECF transporter T component, partial [Treponemataceae bacterium]|nr:CbiQ family ECF transporter T component [Treponemataceae bacterium]
AGATRKVRATSRHNRLSVRIRSMASLFVPLILRTLTRAERLSQAITARYYGTRVHSRYLEWKAGRIELFLRVALPLAAAALVYASIATRMYLP